MSARKVPAVGERTMMRRCPQNGGWPNACGAGRLLLVGGRSRRVCVARGGGGVGGRRGVGSLVRGGWRCCGAFWCVPAFGRRCGCSCGALAGRWPGALGALGALLVILGPGLVGLGRMLDRRPDVVALIVVGVLAEVLLVLGGHDAALGGLLDREADAATLQVEVDDLDPQLLAGGDHLLRQVDVVRR